MANAPKAHSLIASAFEEALKEASRFMGATSPNPPVGAAALGAQGEILSVQAHEKAGTPHAEAKVIQDLEERGILGQATTLVVTLEPCNHHGRTPACSEAILKSGIRHVFYGTADPNPKASGGAAFLRSQGIKVEKLDAADPMRERCEKILEPFRHWIRTGRPLLTIKTAITADGSMIPPVGQKTFTSPAALQYAHELRRRADAIITGSGTVLADFPQLNVRRVPDHPGKRRYLVVMDRRGRIREDDPACHEWLERARTLGFEVVPGRDLEESLNFLGKHGCLEALVEAGPQLTQAAVLSGFWARHVLIKQREDGPEEIQEILNPAAFP